MPHPTLVTAPQSLSLDTHSPLRLVAMKAVLIIVIFCYLSMVAKGATVAECVLPNGAGRIDFIQETPSAPTNVTIDLEGTASIDHINI